MAIYLDYAAATPLDDEVFEAMRPFFTKKFHNPSAVYGPANEVTKALNLARADCAAILGSKPSEIIFTAGGTEANNLAIHGVMQKFTGSRVVISAIEHDSVRAPAEEYSARVISVDNQGLVNPETLSGYIDDKTVLISVMYANNEIGTVQPIRKIAAELAKIRIKRAKNKNDLPLYLHIDAAQAGNYLDMHVHRLGVDLMTINGGKIYGPKQSGALFIKTGVSLQPLIMGGGQERGLRSGTENVAGAVGLATALKKSTALRHSESNRIAELRNEFASQLQKNFPEIVINGSIKYRLPNNLHFTLPGTDNERVLMALDMEEIYAAAGSACSASSEEPSQVLKAIGLSSEGIRGSLRFSLGRQTTSDEVALTVQALKRILA